MKNLVYTQEKINQIKWKDLLHLTFTEKINELFISLPWLASSLILAWLKWYLPALACSFMFFLCGLRQCHNGFHFSLGISKQKTEWLLFTLSLLMLCSMHAVKFNHLQHHKHCMGEKDVEGSSARMKWWMAILYGPLFPIRLNLNALKNGNSELKKWVVAENIFIASLLFAGYLSGDPILIFHLSAMLAGECFTAFFAVWTVHHDCDNETHFSRTQRGKIIPRLFYNMFYHTEHHLFPKVPTCHLPELAGRIEKIIPEIAAKQVVH